MKYVILGASAAGINAIKTLREEDKDSKIVLISQDKNIYSRCMLHHVISNHKTVEDINFSEGDFCDKYNVEWIKSKKVINVNTDLKEVQIEDLEVNSTKGFLAKLKEKFSKDKDSNIAYDKLLIATGASSFVPPIPNLKESNFVYGLRNIEDVYQIKEKAKSCKNVAVLGSGLVGIDALFGLLEYENLSLSLVFLDDFILSKQLDKHSANTYQDAFIKKGVKIYSNVSIKEITQDENKNVTGIKLQNGDIIKCEMLIAATGVAPNADFIDKDKISYDRGIVINDKCETTAKDVYAAGDVVGKNAIWPIAVKQGIVAGHNMASKEDSIKDSFTFKNSMNFLGIGTISLGICNPPDDTYKVRIRKDKDNYKKIVYKDDVIYGAILQGDISYAGSLMHLIKNKVKVDNLEDKVFDLGYGHFFKIKENGEFEYNV